MRKIVVKFGGSLFTDKDTIPFSVKDLMENAGKYIKYKNITRVAKETLEAVEKHGDISFLWLIHGVGPFGHFLIQNDRWKELGSIKKTHDCCKFLNDIVIQSFREVGLPVSPIHPIETCYSTNNHFNCKELYERGLTLFKESKIPFTHGDIVPTSTPEYKVLSGDDIAVFLAERWDADILMVTDVDVSDKDPKKFKYAKIVKEISRDEKIEAVDTNRVDVSGGIYEKIRKLQQAAKKEIRCKIINGAVKGNIYKALMGDEKIGTRIV